MSFDLLNDAGEGMSFSNTGWRHLLEFARAHGFRWPKQQNGEDADSLTSAASREMAGAIEGGMGVGSAAEVAARVSDELTKLLVIRSTSAHFRQEPITLTPQSIEHWREFAAYARRGGFSISF